MSTKFNQVLVSSLQWPVIACSPSQVGRHVQQPALQGRRGLTEAGGEDYFHRKRRPAEGDKEREQADLEAVKKRLDAWVESKLAADKEDAAVDESSAPVTASAGADSAAVSATSAAAPASAAAPQPAT